ncbi:MAG: PQQ-dependent sugar dehydrogenase, partial [Sphingobacteriales bacterium]
VPTNNPMVGRAGVRPEIYSYGNRNVQGIAVRPGTRDVWMHEHGPKGGDEVNILKAGTNYGWPLATFGVDYSGLTITSRTTVSGTVDPLVHWTPSIAPSGLAFYTGTAVPQWRNDAFVGALAGKQLRRLDLEEGKVVGEEVLLKDMDARIRDVRMGPDGHLYVVTDERDGKIVRLDTL